MYIIALNYNVIINLFIIIYFFFEFYIYNTNGYYNLNIQMFFDAVTLRNALPIGFSDNLLTTSRMYPSFEINSNSLQLTNYNNYKTISFQPGKCASNLPLIKMSQNISVKYIFYLKIKIQ
jgi:hypothetical protein